MAMTNPFRYFNSSPDVIRLVVMMYLRYPLSLRDVEDLLGSGTELGVRLAIGYIKGLEKWRQADDGGEVDGLGREEAC